MSKRHDDLEALRRAFASLPAIPPDPAACPPAERILAAVAGELPPAELRDLLAHVAACPACAEDWRLAAELERSAGEGRKVADFPTTAPGRSRLGRLAAWGASVAAAVVLVVVGLLPGLHGDRSAVLRGTREGPKLEAAEILSREACVLRWSPLPGATYDLDVQTEDGRHVEQRPGLTTRQYRIPPARLAEIPAGSMLTWQVTANLPGGHHLSSARGRFVLR